MSYYTHLQQIEIGKAIEQIVEIAMPRFTKNKILLVNIEISLNNFKGKHERRDIKFVFDRKTAYTFVGAIDGGDEFTINEDSEIEFLGYHDSCWRGCAGDKIRQVAKIMSDKYNGEKGMSVYTSFGVFGNGFVDGEIRIEHTSSNRKASFIKSTK